MEASALSLSEIHFSVSPKTAKFSSQTKINGVRSARPYLRSSLRGPSSAKNHGPLPYKRSQPRLHIVRATSVQDKGHEGIQTKVNGSIFDLLGSIFKMGLGILSQKKQEYEKIEEKIEHAADVVKEVSEDVKEVAKLTEEIAEKFESESAKDGNIYKSAELVDKISEAVAKNAEILENQAEKIQETLKAIDKSVENAEDVVEDFAKSVSTVGNDRGSTITAEKSSTQKVEVKNS